MTPWEYNYIKWLAFHFPERHLQLSGEGVTINLFSGLPWAAHFKHNFFAECANQVFAVSTYSNFFPDYYYTTAQNLRREGRFFRIHYIRKNPTNPNKQFYLNCTGKSNVSFCLELDFFLQFISVCHTTQIIFASWTSSWSTRKTKCLNISLKFSCLVPLNSKGGDITTGLHKAQRHAVTKRYPRPVDWPNRAKLHKEVAFRNVLLYRMDLRQGVQRKQADIVLHSKVALPAFPKSPIIS